MEIAGETKALFLTAPFTQWRLNEIVWKNAKGRAEGQLTAELLPIVLTADKAPYKTYKWGWSQVASSGCDVSGNPEVKVLIDWPIQQSVHQESLRRSRRFHEHVASVVQ